jgi:hypothetical protein
MTTFRRYKNPLQRSLIIAVVVLASVILAFGALLGTEVQYPLLCGSLVIGLFALSALWTTMRENTTLTLTDTGLVTSGWQPADHSNNWKEPLLWSDIYKAEIGKSGSPDQNALIFYDAQNQPIKKFPNFKFQFPGENDAILEMINSRTIQRINLRQEAEAKSEQAQRDQLKRYEEEETKYKQRIERMETLQKIKNHLDQGNLETLDDLTDKQSLTIYKWLRSHQGKFVTVEIDFVRSFVNKVTGKWQVSVPTTTIDTLENEYHVLSTWQVDWDNITEKFSHLDAVVGNLKKVVKVADGLFVISLNMSDYEVIIVDNVLKLSKELVQEVEYEPYDGPYEGYTEVSKEMIPIRYTFTAES